MKASRDAYHLYRHCCTTNKQLKNSQYQASALAARLARTKSLLLLYLDGLLHYLASAALTDGTAAELLSAADMLLQALGQSWCRHVAMSVCHSLIYLSRQPLNRSLDRESRHAM